MDTIVGHLIPGAMFIVAGLWWFRPTGRTSGPFATDRAPFVIIPAAIFGTLVELRAGGWHMTDDTVMNFQHATMYMCFAMSAGLYRLARRGRVPEMLPTLALGGAFAATGMLFVAHGSPTPVSDTIHVLLAMLLFACAVVCVAEAVRSPSPPSPALAVARSWLTVSIGTWFCEAAWLLGVSTYDQAALGVVLRVRMFFIWHLAAAGIVLVTLHLIQQRRLQAK